ncbi:MAG: hypothetical protein K0S23_3249 [Fluviicola sp.]|jgi:hypothetical protein|uniref:hypothetical protein n=1 Tax=Fluviicola sp. TaxID=1917219 RepID=UPI002613A191|nr:hypothetical protein [Fluviicola sp.]MDF3028942.1 hypothetical protein [Fluviicola sp.]
MFRRIFFLQLLIGILCLFHAFCGFSQERKDSLGHLPIEYARFVKNKDQRYGFYEWVSRNKEGNSKIEVFKSVGKGQTDVVDFKINRFKFPSVDSIEFFIRNERINSFRISEIKQRIFLPASNKDYEVLAKYRGNIISTLHVTVLPLVTQQVRIVPLLKIKINRDSIEKELNDLFGAANVRFDVTIEPVFENDALETANFFENPGADRLRYTVQMRHVRDTYKQAYKGKTTNTLLFFVVPSFVNPELKGYMVKNKALGFIAKNNSRELSQVLANEYLDGFVNITGTDEQGRNQTGWEMNNEEWPRINKNPRIYSIIDDYEEVVTNNGLIAYYFFEQAKDGTIILKNKSFLASVLRPMKKNTYSYHLQIDNILYKTLFRIKSKPFNTLHLLSVLAVVSGFIYGFRKLRSFLKARLKKPRWVSFLSRVIQWTGILVLSYALILVVDLGYSWFEVTDGIIKSYSGRDEKKVLSFLFDNKHPNKLEEKAIGSELIIKRDKNYFLYERKKVLYFKMNVSKSNVPLKLRLIANSDSLKTSLLDDPIVAESHYMVVKIYSPKGKWLRDQVYNHLGVDLTAKLKLQDPPKRILIFVNGYRPTSLGSTFEENFEGVRSNGLEFPNSLNRLFTEDRYNYWNPWRQIDDTFKIRINPTEYYYADGHHSVATSNHRSLLNFSTNSSIYPKRCKNKTHHICYTTSTVGSKIFGSKKAKTFGLLATKSNKGGFSIRANSGRIAGRNLYQMLNELPNSSANDTLYIIAHSMGFAYAQGIIREMRGKINFGGYYILAAENPAAGNVNLKEWKQVWQYGSNLHTVHQDAPCLQDGVAPQASVKGLTEKQRIYIPRNLYKHKGYFDSHFIGYYNWILHIPSGKKGHIQQR